ncbi:MAG: zinc ribbon domain-containing protein [Prevotella sp.]|nr:zinc ribbon domain-containing protein [Prevotella sp.]
MKETKNCPYCGEEILAVAKKCKHCGTWLEESHQSDTPMGQKAPEGGNQQAQDIDSNEKGTKTRKILLALGALVVIGIVGFVMIDGETKEDKGEYAIELSQRAPSSKPTEEESYEEVISSEAETYSDNDTIAAYDPWLGRFRIDGCIYRLCDSRAFLDLEKSGDNYVGTIDLILGYRDDMERISLENGELKGRIRARDTRDGLLVTMVNYTTTSGENYDLFSGENGVKFKEGDQIFLITYSNLEYTTKAIGKMENFFDGCGVTTYK